MEYTTRGDQRANLDTWTDSGGLDGSLGTGMLVSGLQKSHGDHLNDICAVSKRV